MQIVDARVDLHTIHIVDGILEYKTKEMWNKMSLHCLNWFKTGHLTLHTEICGDYSCP